MQTSTPWIYSPKFDLVAIIGPSVLITFIVMIWGNQIAAISDTPTWLWIFLVLGIDVAHVYSSLFRTYFDNEEFQKRRTLYIVTPIVVWLVGCVSYWTLGRGVFWSMVAYFAIYHFVRQQYGFMMLYRRGEKTGDWKYRIDQLAIYLATVYPLMYWHTYPRNFQWFSNFEVLHIPWTWPEMVCRLLYIMVMTVFVIKEVWQWRNSGTFNAGKMLITIATAVSWATGIILFNGDLTFTLINIISHGIPYIALIWIYQYRKRSRPTGSKNGFLKFFQLKYVAFYVAALIAFSYFEEGLWDWFVWKEHSDIFGSFRVAMSEWVLVFFIPLLCMPQVTHYVLDAFIWRVNKSGKEEIRSVLGTDSGA